MDLRSQILDVCPPPPQVQLSHFHSVFGKIDHIIVEYLLVSTDKCVLKLHLDFKWLEVGYNKCTFLLSLCNSLCTSTGTFVFSTCTQFVNYAVRDSCPTTPGFIWPILHNEGFLILPSSLKRAGAGSSFSIILIPCNIWQPYPTLSFDDRIKVLKFSSLIGCGNVHKSACLATSYFIPHLYVWLSYILLHKPPVICIKPMEPISELPQATRQNCTLGYIFTLIKLIWPQAANMGTIYEYEVGQFTAS